MTKKVYKSTTEMMEDFDKAHPTIKFNEKDSAKILKTFRSKMSKLQRRVGVKKPRRWKRSLGSYICTYF